MSIVLWAKFKSLQYCLSQDREVVDFVLSFPLDSMVKLGYSRTNILDRIKSSDYDDVKATYLLLARLTVSDCISPFYCFLTLSVNTISSETAQGAERSESYSTRGVSLRLDVKES